MSNIFALPNLIPFHGRPMELMSNADMSGEMGVRHLLGDGIGAVRGAVVDYVELPPGFVHGMHRHPGADQLVIPFAGTATLLTEAGGHLVGPGSLGVVHRGEFHEMRNETDETVRALLMYPGASTLADVGYESRTSV